MITSRVALRKSAILLVVAAIFVIVLLRNAWMCDDAYITLRTVDNFVNGYGLTWNVVERVQSYTHPLWMMFLATAYFVTREAYFTTIFLSLLLSVAAVLVVAHRVAATTWTAVLAVLVLAASKAFVDFSVCGLENPLTNIILAVFFAIFLKPVPDTRFVFWLALLTSLGALCRLDTLLIFIPPLAYYWWRLRHRQTLRPLFLGFLPLIIWETFSLFYYGFLLPNTAYAKLNTSIATSDLMQQGLYYLYESLQNSPVTLVVIFLALLFGFLSRRPSFVAASIGIVLYVLFIARVGGDFMTGRFLVPPLFVSVIVLSRFKLSRLFRVVGLLLILVGVFWPLSPVLSGSDFGLGEEALYWNKGIGDERAAIFRYTGLFNSASGLTIDDHHWAVDGRAARDSGATELVRGGVGIYGYYSGPDVHVIDKHALCDALLARLPAWTPKRWRTGHITRYIPEGYEETIKSGRNVIQDADLAAYYDKLKYIIRGDLFEWTRLKEVIKMNLGFYDGLLEAYTSRPMMRVDYARASRALPEGSPSIHKDCFVLPPTGMQVGFEQVRHDTYLEIGVDNYNDYTLSYFNGPDTVASQNISVPWFKSGGIKLVLLKTPSEAAEQGYDRMVIRGVGGDSLYSVSHVLLFDLERGDFVREILRRRLGFTAALSADDNLAPASWSFGGKIDMVGLYPVAVGDSIQFWFAYEAIQELDKDYRVFFHLLTVDGPETFFNYDFKPIIPTSHWSSSQIIVQCRTIPDPGVRTKLATGFFDEGQSLGGAFVTYYDTKSKVPAPEGR